MIARALAAATLGIAMLVTSGCSSMSAQHDLDGEATEVQIGSEQQPASNVELTNGNQHATRQATIGEVIPVSTDRGNFNVTINGFEDSQSMYDQFAQYEAIDDGLRIGLLLLTVENVTYDTGDYDTMFIEGDVYVEDSDGITINPMNGAYDYGQYEAAPGYAFDCVQGQTKRVAVPFQIPEGLTDVTVVIGDNVVPVQITQGQ